MKKRKRRTKLQISFEKIILGETTIYALPCGGGKPYTFNPFIK